MEKPVNCLMCQFYYVTWDARHPKGCRYFGFKGMKLPSLVVKESSGEACKVFTPKKPDNEQRKP